MLRRAGRNLHLGFLPWLGGWKWLSKLVEEMLDSTFEEGRCETMRFLYSLSPSCRVIEDLRRMTRVLYQIQKPENHLRCVYDHTHVHWLAIQTAEILEVEFEHLIRGGEGSPPLTPAISLSVAAEAGDNSIARCAQQSRK